MHKKILHNKIFAAVAERKKFALVMHRKPDGDTIGAATAFSLLLKNLKKEFKVFCSDKIHSNYEYLLKLNGIEFDVFGTDEIFNFRPECVVLFDCCDWKQASLEDEKKRKRLPFFINIDHHASNQGLCDLNLLMPEMSSTCEILHLLFKNNSFRITQQIATCLFMGIFTDTGVFSNPATNVSSFNVASELMLRGARAKDAFEGILKNQSVTALKLWGTALLRLRFDEKEKIITTFLTRGDFQKYDVIDEEVEGISNFLRGSVDVRAIVVFRELENGFIKASVRSDGNFDAAEYAKKFGGGGHKKAAGFTIKGDVKDLRDKWEILAEKA